MKSSLNNISKKYPLEGLAVFIGQLEDTGILKEGEKVAFQFPELLQKAASNGINIFDLKNLVKILNVQITGEPTQILYTYKIMTESEEHEVSVTAIEFLMQAKLYNQKFDL